MSDDLKPRRHPLVKERFLEGNRQRFTIILIVCMFMVMACEVKYHIVSASYLSFLTFVGSFFLGGATVSAWVAANKSNLNQNVTTVSTTSSTDTSNVNVAVSSNKNETLNKNLNETLTGNLVEEGTEGAPAIKPFSQNAVGGN